MVKFDMGQYPLLTVNLDIAQIKGKYSRNDINQMWARILDLCDEIEFNGRISDWLLSCYEMIKKEALGEWNFQSGQNLFIDALNGQGCNCTCGCQLLLCLAEWKDKIGEIGEAKWRNHTTLAYKDPNTNQIWILETTNRSPRWRKIEDIKRCFFQTEFRSPFLLLHSLGELGHPGMSKKQIQQIFSSSLPSIWNKQGGSLAEILYYWALGHLSFQSKSFPYILQALELESHLAGELLMHKIFKLLAKLSIQKQHQLSLFLLEQNLTHRLISQCPTK